MTTLPVVTEEGASPRRAATAIDGPVTRAIEELTRGARARLARPKNFFTWLSLARRFELRAIRPLEVKVKVPAGTLPDCAACTDVCCTGPNAIVSLRLRDIARLMDRGLAHHVVHDRPATTTGASTWARYEHETSVFARMFPVLSRDATGTCRLLDEDLQCTAWPDWPLSCARYPYALDALRKEVFLAKGCRSHRMVTLDDPPRSVVKLVDAAVESYNARITDVILLHTALEELASLGLVQHLRLFGSLQKRAARLASPAG